VVKKVGKSLPVSGNNPCPFLRALVSEGMLSDDREPLDKVAAVIVATGNAGDGSPVLPSGAIVGIGLLANGLSPLAFLENKKRGLRLNALRGGPLDKKGVGSGILDPRGNVDSKELARLRGFAKRKASKGGSSELGLALPELRAYMDANFERAAGRRRLIDRTLMIGEWPVLLKVLGKEGTTGRYLSLRDVEELFIKRRLPERIRERLESNPISATAQAARHTRSS
jgi:hypothetical protein